MCLSAEEASGGAGLAPGHPGCEWPAAHAEARLLSRSSVLVPRAPGSSGHACSRLTHGQGSGSETGQPQGRAGRGLAGVEEPESHGGTRGSSLVRRGPGSGYVWGARQGEAIQSGPGEERGSRCGKGADGEDGSWRLPPGAPPAPLHLGLCPGLPRQARPSVFLWTWASV